MPDATTIFCIFLAVLVFEIILVRMATSLFGIPSCPSCGHNAYVTRAKLHERARCSVHGYWEYPS